MNGTTPAGQRDRERDEPRQLWIITGPFGADDLPVGCQGEKVPPELVKQLVELLRGLEKLARLVDT